MSERPLLDEKISSSQFRSFYYLKDELVAFCRKNGLPVSGSKLELTERIAYYLDTGKVLMAAPKPKKAASAAVISLDTLIEPNYSYSETSRAFFKEHIGSGFSFNVPFQRWLKSNAGKTHGEAIAAYYQLLEDRKTSKPAIDRQFEYNTYIRDFFADNSGKTLADAIKCWKYKKRISGHNRYERSDLAVLNRLPGT